MKAARKTTLLSLLVVCCLVVFGCSKKEDAGGDTSTNTGTDQSGSISKAETEAANMDVDQLRAAALECKAAAEAKAAETEKVAQDLIKTLGANNADNTDKRQELNAQMQQLKKSEDALCEQLKVYVDKLKEKGGDVSGLEL